MAEKLSSPKKVVTSPRKLLPPSAQTSAPKRTLPPKTLANYFKVSPKPKNNDEVVLPENYKGKTLMHKIYVPVFNTNDPDP